MKNPLLITYYNGKKKRDRLFIEKNR